VEYRFLSPQQYSEFERAVIIAETRGQPIPTEPIEREEKVRRTSDGPMLEKADSAEKKRPHRKSSPPTAHKNFDVKRERSRDAEKIPTKDTNFNYDANI
jgi:hypothetical protein